MKVYLARINEKCLLEITEIFSDKDLGSPEPRLLKNREIRFIQRLTYKIPMFHGFRVFFLDYNVFYFPENQWRAVYQRVCRKRPGIGDRVRETDRNWRNENKPGAWRVMLKAKQFATSKREET